MDAPAVSVLMSTCDDAGRVEKAVASILQQTFSDLEFIVIDDGSRDGSAELLDRLASRDARMRVVHQANAGLTKSLMHACGIARGRYLARQDSDDWSHPQRLAEQVALIETDDRIGFVSCATQFVGPEDEPLVVMARGADPLAETKGLLHDRRGPPAHGSVLMRKELYERVGGYREPFHYSQDSDLWLRLAAICWIAYVPGVRYYHRKDVGSTSGARRAVQSRFADIAHRCRAARDSGESEAPLLEEAMALTRELRAGTVATGTSDDSGTLAMNYLIGAQLARNGDARARHYLYRVISARPSHWKAWVRLGQSWLQRGKAK